MKLGYVCADPGVPVFGRKGCSLHVQEMIRALRQLDVDVSLLAYRLGGAVPPSLTSVPVFALPELIVDRDRDRESLALEANVNIADAVGQHGPFDVLYERYALWSHAALSAGKACGATTVLEVNAPLIDEQRKFRSLRNEAAAIDATRRVLTAADLIVAVSEEVGRYLDSYPESRGKINVIPNGVDADRFRHVPALRLNQYDRFTLGFVGTLKPWHGVDVLVQAFAAFATKVGGSRLLIVGDGPERESLRALVSALGIANRVSFTGSVPPDAIPGLLAKMDVGVAPYPDLKSFYFSPLKAYEYMASGLPVVASRIGQLNDIVDHGTDGLLCTPGSAEELCDAFCRIYDNPGTAFEMGRRGQHKVCRNHSWRAVAGKVLGLVRQVRKQTLHQGLAS